MPKPASSSPSTKSTRLDKLFILLKDGSSPQIRKTAADQIGEVVRLHPHEIGVMLGKLKPLLVSKNWDTRVAAAQAVEALADKMPPWDPKVRVKHEAEADADAEETHKILLDFDMFDICKILFFI
jgi:TATA-binding protein-associated factor